MGKINDVSVCLEVSGQTNERRQFVALVCLSHKSQGTLMSVCKDSFGQQG